MRGLRLLPAGASPLDADPGGAGFTGDEEALVARAQRDPLAFAPLYERYYDRVYRYCFWRLRDPEDAADATSKVFLRALEALPRYRTGSFRSWLFSIAHNTVVDAYRQARPERSLEAALDAIAGGPSLELVAEQRADLEAILGLLSTLSLDQRRVLELRLAGLTGPEIAGVLGRSHAAVKMLQARAVAKLQECWLARTGGRHDRDG